MDTNSSFIGQLRDIRSNLRDSIRAAAHFETKLLGPRPEEGKATKEPVESIGSLLSEINTMSIQLGKILAHHHDIVGDFQPAVGDAVPARYA
jgi:hypothetical protein